METQLIIYQARGVAGTRGNIFRMGQDRRGFVFAHKVSTCSRKSFLFSCLAYMRAIERPLLLYRHLGDSVLFGKL